MKVLSRLLLLALLIASLGLFGCEGDDGDDGAPGAAGATGATGPAGPAGPPGPGAEVTPVEGCGICHDDGKIAGASDSHALSGQVAVSSVAFAASGADLVVSFNLKVDGANVDNLTVNRARRYHAAAAPATGYLSDDILSITTKTSATGGNYTLTIANGATNFGADPSSYYFRMRGAVGDSTVNASFVTNYPSAPSRAVLVSDAACINCHGATASSYHHGNPNGVAQCVVCHTSTNYNPAGVSLAQFVHGIHNSHNMPSGHFELGEDVFSVTFPTYMNNCSVCHDTAAGANVIVNTAVDYEFCMGCHGGWASFGDHTGIFGGVNHNSFTANCNACHGAGVSNRVEVADFHNGLVTERGGLIWNGRDVSVDEGAKVNMQITGIARSGDNLNVTWTAAYNGAAVNPCNTNIAVGAPIFHAGGAANPATGLVASNLSFLKGFGQGDDWVNDGAATSPGQANAVTLTTANTTCTGNVATTVVPLTAAEKISSKNGRGVLALQGKAQVIAPNSRVVQVRSKTPTREYVVDTGALPADTRREIVDTAACLKCHVGSLYQHGGNRIDNVDMCVICHNEASSEQNVRTGDGVNAAEAYDGQPGQTYGFKSFLHGVHSAGETGKITMIYRTMGVFVWAADEADVPNWPGTGAQTVYGSVPAGTNTAGTTRVHNFHAPTYPRLLNDCAACHKPDTQSLPDQTLAVATTIDAGVSPWGNGLDDSLEGASAAACMSCHQSGESYDQSILKAHAYQNGWYPAVFEEGRKTIIDAAK